MASKQADDPLHDRILATATTLFGENGVSATSMRQIAEEIGVTKAAIYYHFDSKDQLHFEIQLRLINSVLEEVAEITASDDDPATKIRRVVSVHMRQIADNREAFSVLLREGGSLDTPHWAELAKHRDQYRRELQKLIESGVEAGEFEVEDAGVATLALLGMCNWAYTWVRARGRVPVDAIASQFADIFIEGVRARRRR